jgi:N-acetylglucosaminyldiphosphoundecaprenol N-acetyl-beta-D-mannosaminyltransferase
MNRSQAGLPSIDLLGMNLAAITSSALVDHMFQSLDAGRGGWIVTANLDFMRRYVRDPNARDLYAAADIRVADGMPLVWASRMQGANLPERIAGSTVVSQIVERAAAQGRSLYLLGGPERARLKALETWQSAHPTLVIAGQSGPMITDPPGEKQLADICAELERTHPDIILCGFGTPKQEHVLRAIRARLPAAWMMGIGGTFSFIAGDVARAPLWMQRAGLEWLHRLSQEPRRLAKRYLVEDLPFAAELFSRALLDRARRKDDA